jgi:hypothetical protein
VTRKGLYLKNGDGTEETLSLRSNEL